MPEGATFEGYVEVLRLYTELDSQLAKSEIQRCMFSAMNAYFEGITVHGSNDQLARVPLAHFMAEFEKLTN